LIHQEFLQISQVQPQIQRKAVDHKSHRQARKKNDKRYDDNVWCEEGCLSFPDEIINVERPDRIVVKYEDEDKKDHKIKLSGMASRVFLHEFDHLEGIVFTERQ